MNRLVAAIADHIEHRMRGVLRTLNGADGALRSVFHGPPMLYLEKVLERLCVDGGLDAALGDGTAVRVPVLLPLERLAQGAQNPPVGSSGVCDESHLLALRNTPACPRYLTLIPPARQSILSLEQAVDAFGLLAEHNGGGTSIDDWWRDAFVQQLVDEALNRHDWKDDEERQGARELLELAVRAADEAEKQGPDRRYAWAALSRVHGIADRNVPFAVQWSLACGFPPVSGGAIDAGLQARVLRDLADALVDEGYAPTSERMKSGATEEERLAIDECLRHLRRGCDVPLELARSIAFYYGPCREEALSTSPGWWETLGAGRLAELLERDDTRDGAIAIECPDALLAPARGLPWVFAGPVALNVTLPDEAGLQQTTVNRDAPGKGNKRQWILPPGVGVLVDDTVPEHDRPIRYLAAAGSLKRGAARIVSLASWSPGVLVSSKSATKLTLPKRAKSGSSFTYECHVTLAGEGRHFLDVLTAPGVGLSDSATGVDTSTAGAAPLQATIAAPPEESHGFWGMEILATNECYYDLTYTTVDGANPVLRLYFDCEDAPTEGCGSEFERLLRLNRAFDRGPAGSAVQVNRQVRVADLQDWSLAPENVELSFYPLVIAADCREAWRQPTWDSADGTVLSRGKFLHDPRPPFSDFTPPEEFIQARRRIALRIRGEEHGLAEAAELGAWMADPEFAEDVDAYVRTYSRWLLNEPDVAAWVDLVVVASLENDGHTLALEPDAVIVTPLHPIRVAWHALAQRALLDAARAGSPCPAASILDPDSVPDIIVLPLRTAAGGIKRVAMLAAECGSDYWAVLWNGSRIGRLATHGSEPPFDSEFGLQLGGVSSGFSASQVRRALDDVSGLLAAKPLLNVLVARSPGQSDACNEGVVGWARDHFGPREEESSLPLSLGDRALHVLDERAGYARPDAATIANLAEDTSGAVRWYSGAPLGTRPDLGIIAQLETTNAVAEPTALGSPLGMGALLRHRVRKQLVAGAGAFLSESRMGIAGPPSGDALSDHVSSAVASLENLGEERFGYTFAPSVQSIREVFEARNTEYVAVSSSAVDPACFLGAWLDGVYLWDYELPSYSHRAGDTNGYYLLSRVKGLDCDALHALLQRLPGCEELDDELVKNILLEVSRRGIPTVRGLSAGHSGAVGDLGLFLAGRLLQDEFRATDDGEGLLPVLASDADTHEVLLVIPVDPFRGYLMDLQRATRAGQFLRPDLIVAGIIITDSVVRIKITPVEVKQRQEQMSQSAFRDALGQAAALSALLSRVRDVGSASGLVMWRLAFEHLLLSILDFGFRVYSQQVAAKRDPDEWARLHHKVAEALLSGAAQVEIDVTGRLIAFDGSVASAARDTDGDGFDETIVVAPRDAANIVNDAADQLFTAMRSSLRDWSLFPSRTTRVARDAGIVPRAERGAQGTPQTSSTDAGSPVAPVPEVQREPTSFGSVDHEPARGQLVSAPPSTAPRDSVADVGKGVATNSPAANSPDASAIPGSSHVGEPAAIEYETVAGSDTAMLAVPATHGMRVLVGHTADNFRSEPQYLQPSLTKLNQLNIGVVGDLGTGKTQLVKSLVYQMRSGARENDGVRPRFLILDYKRDYGEADFLAAVGGKVVAPFQLPLNLFDARGANTPPGMPPWMPRFRFFADVLGKIYSGIGPVQLGNLKSAVKGAYEGAIAVGRQPTIYDVYDRYHSLVQGRADAPLGIISDMVDMELFSREPADATAFGQFLDGVVVLALDQLGPDDRTKNMIVAIMLNMFYEHMLCLPKRPYRGTDPQLRTIDSYLLVDEAENIMRFEFDVLRTVLLQGREFGVGVILASQYLKHFKAGATDYREPLLSWFIHKVPNVTAQELSALGMPGSVPQLAARVQQLENHQFLYKTFDVPGTVVRGKPFFQIRQEERKPEPT